MMWLGRSPLSCTISSPRSVSTTSISRLLEMGVEPDLLRHHRLALGDELGARLLAELEDDGAGIGRARRVMHLAAALDHLALVSLEIKVEMRQRVVLDGAGFLAQRIELGQLGLRRPRLTMKPRLTFWSAFCKRGVGERPRGAGLEVVLRVCHRRLPSAFLPRRGDGGSSSCRPAPRRRDAPRRRPRAGDGRRYASGSRDRRRAPSRRRCRRCRAPWRRGWRRRSPDISPKKAPPKPQHTSLSPSSTSDSPPTLDSSCRGASRTCSSRKDEQES